MSKGKNKPYRSNEVKEIKNLSVERVFKTETFMAGLWDYFKNLFKEAEQSSPSNPLIHKLIERSDADKEDYQHWKKTLVCRRLLDWLHDQYAISRVAPNDIDEALDFLDTPSSKGFVIHFHKTQYSKRDVTHFFDYLKEQVKQLGYRVQISDSRTYNRPNWVETVDKHYLKPRLNIQQSGQLDQKFGNILIEILLKDEQIFNLKFRATTYHDRQFKDASNFENLMHEVLQ